MTIRVEHQKNYTCITNSTIRDKHLSFKARGLHHLLLSYPDGWQVKIEHLVGESEQDGRTAVASALRELEEHGYLERKQKRDSSTGKLGEWESIIREYPTENRKPDCGVDLKQETRKQETRKRVNRNQVFDSIINTNTEQISKKEVSTLPLPPQGERESEKKFGFEIPKEPMPESSASLLIQSDVTHEVVSTVIETIVAAPAEMVIKYDPALGIRPPRQRPKYKYPDGPWLNDAGQINEDFIRDRALLWRTGDTTASKGFGAMAIEDVIGLVCGHYQRTENHAKLENDWIAYVTKNQRYVANVQTRVAAGIEIKPDEQSKILQKVPALISEKLEPAYGNAIADPLVKVEPPLLESVATVSNDIWDTVAAATGQEQAQFIKPPEGATDTEMYTRTAKSEDSDYFRKLHEKATLAQNQNFETGLPQTREELKNRICVLNDRRAMPKLTKEQTYQIESEEASKSKLAYWSKLLSSGLPEVVKDVERKMKAQGYELIDGQIVEIDF